MTRCLKIWPLTAGLLCVAMLTIAKTEEKKAEVETAPAAKSEMTAVEIEKRIADIDKELLRIGIEKNEVLKAQEQLGKDAATIRLKSQDNDDLAVLRDRIRIVRAELRKLQKELNAMMLPDPEYQKHLKKAQKLGQQMGDINSRRSNLMREKYGLQQDLSHARFLSDEP